MRLAVMPHPITLALTSPLSPKGCGDSISAYKTDTQRGAGLLCHYLLKSVPGM